jgi:two-component system NarL family sensor kinase
MAEELNAEENNEKLRQRNRELSILHKIAEALNRETNLDRALQTALAQVADLFDLHTGWIFLLQEKTGEVYLAAAQNLPPALARNACRLMQGDDCTCLDSYAKGGLDHRDRANVITCSRLIGLVAGTDGLRYHASIPLYAYGKPLGVLNVASSESYWWVSSSHRLNLLHTVGDLLSIAIERARLFEQSAQLGAIEERNRLAREFHDTIAQGLTGITLQLESIDAMLEAKVDPAKVRQTVQHSLTLARTNLDEVRRSVLDLRAAPLEGHDLAEALTLLAETYMTHGRLPVRLTINGGSRPLPIRVEVGLYRIVQESLTNIARHAEANRAEIDLSITPDLVRLTIEDDGRGFDPAQVPQGHFGLIGLNERVKLLGGKLQLETSPEAGVRIEVVIPLN